MIAGLFALILSVSLDPSPGCRTETAQVAVVHGTVAVVVMTEDCLGVTCWRRWLQVDETRVRVGESRACDARRGNGGSPIRVEPPRAP